MTSDDVTERRQDGDVTERRQSADTVQVDRQELLAALVCLHYLGRLGGKRCGECLPCLMADRIDGKACDE